MHMVIYHIHLLYLALTRLILRRDGIRVLQETTTLQPNRIASHNQDTLLLGETTGHAHDSKRGIRVRNDKAVRTRDEH